MNLQSIHTISTLTICLASGVGLLAMNINQLSLAPLEIYSFAITMVVYFGSMQVGDNLLKLLKMEMNLNNS